MKKLLAFVFTLILIITALSQNSFGNCKNIKSITIGPDVKSIETGVLAGCISIESLTIPKACNLHEDNLYHIGRLFGATELERITDCIPKSLETVKIIGGNTIPDDALRNCSGLTSITIPNGVGTPNLHPLKNNGVF